MLPAEPQPTVFHCLDRLAEIEITEHNRPHWFQAGAAIFITFRTADSLPREVIVRWEAELESWLRSNQLPLALVEFSTSRRTAAVQQLMDSLTDGQQREFQRLSSRLLHRSLDECHGRCLLKSRALAEIVAKAILHHEGVKYDVDSFVIMPNHVHAIAQFRAGVGLKVVSQSWMRYSARAINGQLGESGVFWQPEPFDHIIRSPGQFDYLRQYVADNPNKAKLRSGEFLFWRRSESG